MGLLLLLISFFGVFALLYYFGYYILGIIATPFLALHTFFTSNNPEDKKEAKKLLGSIALFSITMAFIYLVLNAANH